MILHVSYFITAFAPVNFPLLPTLHPPYFPKPFKRSLIGRASLDFQIDEEGLNDEAGAFS